MKRIFIILLLTLFISGCTAEYNIKIKENTIDENTSLTIEKNLLNETFYDVLINDNSVYLDEKDRYSIEEQEKGNNTIFSYKYTHDIDKFKESRIINWCYHDKSIINTSDELIISTKGSFDCANRESNSYIESAKINIETDLKVLENNADEIHGNVYTWIVNEDNYRNKPIYIKIEKNNNNLENINFVYLFLIIIFVLILGVLLTLIIKRRSEKVNKC